MNLPMRLLDHRQLNRLVAFFLTWLGASSSAGEAGGEGRAASRVEPVAVWASSPIEVTVAFAEPVAADFAAKWTGRSIGFSTQRRPAGLAAAGPSKFDGTISISGLKWKDEGRTAVLQTDPQSVVGSYFLPLPTDESRAKGALTYVYDLSGVELSWVEENAAGEEPGWMGWWPVLDSRESAAGSRVHLVGETMLAKPGRLTLSSLLTLPAGKRTFGVESKQPIEELILGDQQVGPIETKGDDGTYRAEVEVTSQGDPSFVSVTVRTGTNGGPLFVRSWYGIAGVTGRQAVERSRFLVPWAPASLVSQSEVKSDGSGSVDLAGGDQTNGKKLFFGQSAKCSQCHRFRGEGGNIGPDLTEIGRKPIGEIYRSIAAPSAEIDPLYLTYTIVTRAGRVLSGVVRSDGAEKIRVLDTNSSTTTLSRSEIRQIRPSANSVMPVGLAGVLGEAGVRDVIAYLKSSR